MSVYSSSPLLPAATTEPTLRTRVCSRFCQGLWVCYLVCLGLPLLALLVVLGWALLWMLF